MEKVNLVTKEFENAFQNHKETLKRNLSTIKTLCQAAHNAYRDLTTSYEYREELHPITRLDYLLEQLGFMSLDRRAIVDYYHTVDEQIGINDLRRKERCANVVDLTAALLSTLLLLNVQLPNNYWLGLVFILFYREPSGGKR